MPHAPNRYQRAAAWVVVCLIRLVSSTLRYRWKDESGYFDGAPPGPTIYCFWHNRLSLCVVAYERYVSRRNSTAGITALVSASRDGAFLSAVLDSFRIQAVRGSSSRRGSQALLELTTWAERGYDLAITPDGPRGPCYHAQEGVISLAQITGLPIIPFSFNMRWKLRAKSWDRFLIPLPFGQCEMRLGKPLRVPRDCTDVERETLRQQLEFTLNALSAD